MNGSPAGAGPLYQGTGAQVPYAPYEDREWPAGPPWRTFATEPRMPEPPDDEEADRRLGPPEVRRTPLPEEVRMVNAALLLRRPLLVTGRPGVGKSGLAYRISRELGLGRVLHWPITSRTTLTSGLYEYDAIGRAQAAKEATHSAEGTGAFVQLGPLGTALLPYRLPRVLLIDELDKCDIDLPNDLLTLFEDGRYEIPPLVRVKPQEPTALVHTTDPGGTAEITAGVVRCHAFPVIVMTSNGEREFPEAFMRRCLRLDVPDPDAAALGEMVAAHFGDRLGKRQRQLIDDFLHRSGQVGGLAADQLLNAVHLVTSGHYAHRPDEWDELLEAVWHPLGGEGAGTA
ncbi:ATPase [Streptomyces davaonensis JCM 4913]|uniref:ATPase n=1 Tax=Streptomyces davaonensis (strain DSM 101723 / JCM 4913 / KCC S-0913 / 768) TaxID=1214101 RepID=K4R9W0_STRDJ|nr:MoxR family ATPase [Streptomyces davaonensis]CCK30153.1 ATPase [Streptomyces davaonensis JCM 4913]